MIITAAWVAPMSGPIIRDGAVLFVDQRIAAVGAARELLAANPDAHVHDAGNAVVLPGLINAHTHLELSGCAAGDPPASFPQWIEGMAARIGPQGDFAAAAKLGASQSLSFGVTAVGDISQRCHLTRLALRGGPLRVISYGEALGIGATRFKVDQLLTQALDQSTASDRVTIGVSPHAPYSLERANYFRVTQAAREHGLPIATHLNELPYEREFLANRSGPFREMFERLGIWQGDIELFNGSPIELARSARLIDSPDALLAHVNYCDDDELSTLAAGKASVVYCPRTHAYFGHPPHRWRDMLAAGINVAVGTDSCASSPDLNLVDDLRLMHRIAPETPAQTLWEMATVRAARAIAQQSTLGSLEIGKAADVTIFPVQTDDPLQDILTSSCLPTHVWIAGDRVTHTASRRPASPD
jgi:cytosine/adenosine deaminase-related metal-dependent hydrolase